MGQAIRIIGIDPGLRRTGWGVIDSDGVRLAFVACGSVVSADGESLGARLRQIFDGLQEVLARLEPAGCRHLSNWRTPLRPMLSGA